MAKINLKNFFNFYLTLGVAAWLLLVFFDLFTIYAFQNNITFAISDRLIQLFLTLFFLFTFLSFKIKVGKRNHRTFIEQLWEVFIIGAFTIFLSLFLRLVLYLIEENLLLNNVYLVNFLYHVNMGLITVFIANAFFVWKRMNLYQKSETSQQAWDIFEILILLLLITNFFVIDIETVPFLIISFPLVVYALILSFNLKWVAFLNYNQKWQSILLISLIVFISVTFLQQLFEHHQNSRLIIDLWENVFVLAIFSFIFINCFASLLVLFFNLPTSSVFEQKFGELLVFQKLSQSIQMGSKEDEVYETLIDNSQNIAMADAAWLEIVDESGNYKAFLNRFINEIDIFEIKKVFRKNNYSLQDEPEYIKNIKSFSNTEKIKDLPYTSALIVPLRSQNHHIGTLVLLKNTRDSFDKEITDIVLTFATQATIALRNFRLVSEAVENERYKEELKIAKRVQQRLLPSDMLVNIHLEIHAFTRSSDEIGGDYYDYFEISRNKLALVIGDVSGSGTSAAFNMALMKGVFQSLIQLNVSSSEFMALANKALSTCLEKASFITLSLFYIDVENNRFEVARAGHCPPVYYSSKTEEVTTIKNRGLGLGMLRNSDYHEHIEQKEYSYTPGDILLLYTDGITEAKNKSGEEFGTGKLKEVVYVNKHLSSKKIGDKIIEQVFSFTGSDEINDDYSFLVIKFL